MNVGHSSSHSSLHMVYSTFVCSPFPLSIVHMTFFSRFDYVLGYLN
jgi:hypothetical protein